MEFNEFVILSILIITFGMSWIEKRLSNYYYLSFPVDWNTLRENIHSNERCIYEEAVVFTFDQALCLSDVELNENGAVLQCLVDAVNRKRSITLSYLSDDKRGPQLLELLDRLVKTKALSQEGNPSRFFWERKLAVKT